MSERTESHIENENRGLKRLVFLLLLFVAGPYIAILIATYVGVWVYVGMTVPEGTFFGSLDILGGQWDRLLEAGLLVCLPLSLPLILWAAWRTFGPRRATPDGVPRPSRLNRAVYLLTLVFALSFLVPVVAGVGFVASLSISHLMEQGISAGGPESWDMLWSGLSVLYAVLIFTVVLAVTISALRWTRRILTM